MRQLEIPSYTLAAFIIIDQCSRVFFDRTKPLDMRPEVMDIFAETLGEVVRQSPHYQHAEPMMRY